MTHDSNGCRSCVTYYTVPRTTLIDRSKIQSKERELNKIHPFALVTKVAGYY